MSGEQDDVVYEILLPERQLLEIVVEETTTDGKLKEVAVQVASCPDPSIESDCTPEQQCHSTNEKFNDQYTVAMLEENVSESSQSWFVMVKANRYIIGQTQTRCLSRSNTPSVPILHSSLQILQPSPQIHLHQCRNARVQSKVGM